MANASTLENLSPQLLRVVERAQREPEGRFHSLAHLIDVSPLERAYGRMRKDAAVGVDGVTNEQEFLDCLYGFRPKRRAHDAIRTLDRIVHRGELGRILEADCDVRSFLAQPTVNKRIAELGTEPFGIPSQAIDL